VFLTTDITNVLNYLTHFSPPLLLSLMLMLMLARVEQGQDNDKGEVSHPVSSLYTLFHNTFDMLP